MFMLTLLMRVALLIAVAVSLVLPTVSSAQTPTRVAPSSQPPTLLTPQQLREDFDQLRFTLEHAHAALYRYNSKSEIDGRLDALAAHLDEPLSDVEFFRLVAPLIASIRNSHTVVTAPLSIRRAVSNSSSVFPLDIRFVDGRAFVEADLSDEASVRPESEIVSIDGQSIETLSQFMMERRPVEGFVVSAQYERLNRFFWFDYMLHLGPRSTFTVQTRNPATGSVETFLLAGVPADRVLERDQAASASGPAQQISTGRSNIATMTLRNLGEPDTVAFLASAFQQVEAASAENLIIDIRGNPGGVDWYNSELVAYLVDHPFRFYKSRTPAARSYDDLRGLEYTLRDFLFAEHIETLSPDIRAAPFEHWTLPELFEVSLASDRAGGWQQPKAADRFQGHVYLLVDGASGSSSSEVAALLHHLGIATLIGSEPNGGYQGESAGITPTLTLPNSKLAISIPILTYRNDVMPGFREGRGSPPHFEVSQSVEDARNGVDTVMRFTLALIEARSNVR